MVYVIKQGDYLAKVCKDHGFADYQRIWALGENAQLKSKRKDHNVLLPGDSLFLPEPDPKQEEGATEQRHKFKLLTKPLFLRIKLRGVDTKPLAGAACRFDVDGTERAEVADGDGLLERAIPPSVKRGRMRFDDPALPFEPEVPLEVKVGHLDPIDVRSGQVARLNNLGYDAGPVDLPVPVAPSVSETKTETDGKGSSTAEVGAEKPLLDENDPDFEGEVKTFDVPPEDDEDEVPDDGTEPPIDALELRFRSAVEEFQCDNGLTVDGKCGPNTQAKLKLIHGC